MLDLIRADAAELFREKDYIRGRGPVRSEGMILTDDTTKHPFNISNSLFTPDQREVLKDFEMCL